jgi:pimeloyl-ACP methyl ester carboxylesterase
VLLHGLASTCHIWDLVAPILSQDFRVIVLDQRGHGESDKPDEGYDFASVSEDLHQLIAQVGIDRPIIAGHSWGGDVAIEYAVAHPEVAAGLCLVDGGGMDFSSNPHWDRETARRDMAPPVFSGVTVDQFMERVRERWSALVADGRGREDIVLANFFVQEDRTIKARLSRENHLRIIDSVWDHHPHELYPRIDCPVLLMPARQIQDGTPTPRQSCRAESIARAGTLSRISKTVWLEDSIHDVPVQRPELVASVITDHASNGFFSV